jgi:hypothetical protein
VSEDGLMFALLSLVSPLLPAVDPTPKEALQPFNLLVGSWKGTGYPDGPKSDRTKDFWTETISWEWQFRGTDCWLVANFKKGRHFVRGELRYTPENRTYQFSVSTPDSKSWTYVGNLTQGKMKEQILTLERADPTAKRTERLVFTLLHHNRHLYRLDAKPDGAASFARQFQVGATKEGEPFAAVPTGPECVVSGGRGTIPVTHNGKTYYVCCSGCRDAFKEEPEKFIKEYEAKRKE